ncbi:Cap-specific mRNA (nucleoside-2'-O-)-methyltransferase 2 [Amphibalanus amphitrite]|uniref:Cap-specific mRNA (Nucleoside-2'-O-)-methyltransferase 2 n=1 Tax=Amphibalanus amphitrite TaxID=1232801 RepID=A0A6A4V877_AMPAM|nr:Cap-specific mRNA (nucleoside-2'-O-)-methyltransferase 2 [Amphibalanus amphitrite]
MPATANALTKVEALFGKRFDFERPPDGWRLPDGAELFPDQEWQVTELQTMKRELNAVKSLLSDKDIVAWHEHTCATNRAGLVVASVKRQIRPEMGTQAWCKFYELLSLCSVLPPACESGAAPLRSLHLCEAPGAFVTALNHYCVLNGVQEVSLNHHCVLNRVQEVSPNHYCVLDGVQEPN